MRRAELTLMNGKEDSSRSRIRSAPTAPIPRSPTDSLLRALNAIARRELPDHANLDDRIHFVRVQSKRLNALLQMIRPHLAQSDYRAAKTRLAAAPRLLSEIRDQSVIHDTLKQNLSRSSSKKGKRQRKWLDSTFACADRAESEKKLAVAEQLLESAKLKTPSIRGTSKDLPGIFQAGLKRSYRKALRAMHRADRRGKAERFHRWRKWTKCLALQSALLQSAGIRIDQRILDRMDKLQRKLGAHRDLFLAERFKSHGERVPKAIRTKLRHRRRKLESRLLRKGEKRLSMKPSEFLDTLLSVPIPSASKVAAAGQLRYDPPR